MIIFRAMCDQELAEMARFNSLSWNSKFKWFGTEEFVNNRVRDNKFNNSKFVPDRYKNLVKFTIDDNSVIHFNKCGNREFMLNIRKSNQVKIINWEIVSE